MYFFYIFLFVTSFLLFFIFEKFNFYGANFYGLLIGLSIFLLGKKGLEGKYNNKLLIKKILEIYFFALISLLSFVHIINSFLIFNEYNFIVNFFNSNKFNFFILAISVGSLLFYIEKNKINLELNNIFNIKSKRKNFFGYIYILIFIFFGFLIRYYNVGLVSPENDEGYMLMAIEGLKNHFPLPIMADGYTYIQGAPLTYIAYFLHSIFNIDSLTSIRLVSVFSSTLIILFSYIIGSKLFNKKIALLVSIIISFSLWDIEYARRGRYYALNLLLYITACYYLYLFYINNKNKYLIIFFIISIIAFINHLQSVILFLIFLAVIILKLVKEKKYKHIIFYAIFTTFLFLILMFVVGYIKDGTTNILEVISKLALKINYSNNFLDFFISKVPIITIGLIFGFMFIFNFFKNYKILFLFLFTFFPIIFISFYHQSTAARYIYYATFFPQLLYVLGFFILYKLFNKKLVIFTLLISLFSGFFYYLPGVYSIFNRESGDHYYEGSFRPTPYSQNKIPGVDKAFLELKKEIKNKDLNDIALITTRFDVFYYYLKLEPDYYLKIGTQDFGKNKERKVPFLNKTVHISNINQLEKVFLTHKVSYIIIDNVIINNSDLKKLALLFNKLNSENKFNILLIYSDSGGNLYKITLK